MKTQTLIEQPLLLFLESFFETRNLKKHLLFFEDWFQLVLTDKFYTIRNNPSDILLFHDHIVLLYEKTQKLIQDKSMFAGVSAALIKNVQPQMAKNHLQYLSDDEIINPLLLLRDIFEGYDFNDYRTALRDWLEAALNSGFSSTVGQNIFPLYFNSKKLIEACWLLHCYARKQKEGIDDLIYFEQTCPLLLHESNLTDPYKEIESFFNGASLGEYRKDLKEWFKAALTENRSVKRSSTLVYFHNQIIQLIHAGYLIVKNNLTYQREAPYCSNALTFKDWIIGVKAKAEAETGILTTDYDVISLSEEEKLNPLKYLTKILKLKKIKQIRYGLQEWLYCALSNRSSLQGIEDKYILKLYETVEKLLEVFFLLVTENKTVNGERQNL